MTETLEMTLEDLFQADETCEAAAKRPQRRAPGYDDPTEIPIGLLIAANAYFPMGEGGIVQ